jgi:uncharacterized protein (TIGR04255 family)
VRESRHRIRDFSSPPVIETVLSVQFSPLHSFSVPHFGLYWEKIKGEFPRTEVKPPLGQVKEELRSSSLKRPEIEFVFEPVVRCWFLDKKGNQLIQVQNDRFIYNWQKVDGSEAYPLYETVASKFETEWERFLAFLAEQEMEGPEINQCEVTYINHVEYEKGWKSFGELNQVVASWSGKHSGNFLPTPEKVSISVSYLLPDHLGRLHISVNPVIRARDAKEVLQLSLTARGAPAGNDKESMLKWFDSGRKWVVEGFTDFTTPEMHHLWRRTK